MFGFCVAPVASFFNHSCLPNCAKSHRGAAVRVVALRDIADGEEVSISYAFLTDSAAKRRQTLRYSFLFDCMCERCALFLEHVGKGGVGGLTLVRKMITTKLCWILSGGTSATAAG
jgi:hypothetical protein